MGVSLGSLITGQPITFEDLRNKTIAIDAYNTLYQFLAIIRDRFTGEPLRDSQGRITSHLSGLFYRTSRLLEAGVTPVFVFDGQPPAFKHATIEGRIKIKQEAEVKWKQALKDGDTEKVRMYAQGTSRLTKEMVQEAQTLLEGMGVSWIQAPSEGEAQAVRMLQEGKVWAVGSQDWDSLLFGASRVVRNLTMSGKKKVPKKEQWTEITPELVEMDAVHKELGITREQLILLGMLVGTDYNPGIHGIGPKKALKLVKDHPSLSQLLPAIEWNTTTSAEEIYAFFMSPPTENLDIPKVRYQPERLTTFLAEHSFSAERIDQQLKRLDTLKEQQKQKGLGGFFRT